MARTGQLCVATLLTALLCGALPARAADPGDAILGKWWFPKKNGKMDVAKVGGVYNGKVIEYEKPEQIDDKNPDPALKNRKFVGINMLADFTYDAGDKKWINGTIYDGESGKTYKCSLWFEDNDTSKLNARGYIGISLFGRTEVFHRLTKEEEEAEAKAKAEAEAKAADGDSPPGEEKN